MVSVGISKLIASRTDVIFVDPVVKINGGNYSDINDMLLLQQLSPVSVMPDVSSDFFIFQQDSTPEHRELNTA